MSATIKRMHSDTYRKWNELILYWNDTHVTNLTIVHAKIIIKKWC